MHPPADITEQAASPLEVGGAPPKAGSLLREIARKVFHLATGLIPLAALWLGSDVAFPLLCAAAAALVGAEIVRARWPKLNALFVACFRPILRERECHPRPGRPHFTGSTWMLLSYALLLQLFPLRIAAAAMFIGTVGDPAAAIVGKRFGRRRLGSNGKTLEGSLAFLAACLLAALAAPLYGLSFAVAAVGAVVATVVEALANRLDDNFIVPLAAAAAMLLASSF